MDHCALFRDAAAGSRGAPDVSGVRGQASRRACARPTRGPGRSPPAPRAHGRSCDLASIFGGEETSLKKRNL